ncbi:methyltransferase domain-containing protein [Synechococcus sp. PCC 6312]|uniref:class I SAM-dependent methyltransferase n=1 Tax=Synechococcus sp. (strain ATCC 27167 / PCC 6312) TaxID=195253 RepID=UPI00029EFD7E|nr:methyltransferase domain-containing protein [Synechococcus sp. PCC 6312]AFY62031.1 methyltransferase family protein [Synechococcus sp. PCC 6312]
MTTQVSEPSLDLSTAAAFAERLLGIINSGALSLMVSLGHRARLFDALADLPQATSQAIAEAANLNERYVREWLKAMVVGRIVDYDPVKKTYHLPAEHSVFLTRAATADNMATFAQYIPVLASVEDKILDCFQNGGGVPYSEFSRFHQVMAEDSGQTIVAALEDHILPLVPNLQDRLERGIDVLDVGCGSGRAMNKLASLFPNSRFTGYDLSETAIATAIAEAQEKQLNNARFQVQDTTQLGEVEQYDWITTFDAVHDQARPDWVLQNIYQALRPGGVYLMQDIHASTAVEGNLEHPVAPLLYTVSCLHCMTVSLAAGGLGLGTMWGQEKALELLQEAGFEQVEIRQLAHDVMNDYYITYKH